MAIAGVFDPRAHRAPAISAPGSHHAQAGNVACWFDGRLSDAPDLEPGDDPAAALARGFATRGESVLDGLRGEFALVLWDTRTRSGVAARDQLGGQSLHYHVSGDRLTIGSDVRDVLRLLPTRPGVDRLALAHWIADLDAHGGLTVFDGIRALRPGHLLRLGGRPEVARYWTPRYRTPERVTREEAGAAVARSLDRAVRRACGRDRVGVLMSGGLDSTGVAAFAARAGAQVTAYSGVFPETPTVDESELIAATASMIGIPSVSEPIAVQTMVAGAAAFPREWELPLRTQNLYLWLPLMRRAAADGATVLLDGEGGDLLFAAARDLSADRLRTLRPLSAAQLARQLPGVAGTPGGTRYVLRNYALRQALPPRLHGALRSLRPKTPPVPWLVPADARALAAADSEWDWKRLDGPRWWARLLDALGEGLQAVGIRDHLRRRAAMAGIEERSPFFDVDLAELMLALPPELAFDPALTRPLQRDAMRGLVPDSVRLRPGKSYFDELFQRSLGVHDLEAVRAMLSRRDAELRAFADMDAIRREIVDTHPAQHPRGARFWMHAAWRLVTAESWLRHEAGTASEPTLSRPPTLISA